MDYTIQTLVRFRQFLRSDIKSDLTDIITSIFECPLILIILGVVCICISFNILSKFRRL